MVNDSSPKLNVHNVFEKMMGLQVIWKETINDEPENCIRHIKLYSLQKCTAIFVYVEMWNNPDNIIWVYALLINCDSDIE